MMKMGRHFLMKAFYETALPCFSKPSAETLT